MNNFHIRYFFYKYKLNLSINKLIKLLNKILDDEDNNSKSNKLIYEEPIIFRKND